MRQLCGQSKLPHYISIRCKNKIGKLIDIDLLIEKAKIEAEGMSEPFKSNFVIYVEWLAEKIPPAEEGDN